MTGQQKFTLFLTFITGAFAGGYLYVTSFAPQYIQDNVQEKSEVTIVGTTYGGCMRGDACKTFHLTDTGDYQYVLSEDEQVTGKLPSAMVDAILAELSSYRLQSYAAPAAVRDCRSYVDGIDYTYEISFEGERYTLDTCATLFPHTSNLQTVLLEAWGYMGDPATKYPVIIEEGVGGWLLDYFKQEQDPSV